MPYRYSLERLLRLRTSQEKENIRTLAMAQKGLAEAEHEVHQGQDVIESWLDREVTANLSLDYLRWCEGYGDVLGARQVDRLSRVDMAREHVVKRNEDFAAARRKRRVLELLKEKGLEAYNLEEQRHKQLEYDEMAILRHGRGGK